MDYIVLLIGFLLLIKGADFFVSGAGSIAKKFNVSDLVIGLTVVAFGTSAPELSVSTLASIGGQNSIAISNVVGSNIFNALVVLGVCAIIKPISVDKSIILKEIPISLIATILLFILSADMFLFDKTEDAISRADGVILLIGFVLFLYYILKSSKKNKSKHNETQNNESEIKELSSFLSIAMIILGLASVIFGGDLVVNSATSIATAFGVSETVIGLTIVAIGTSLPELVTSIIACKKGSSDMAIGNVIGSNIFNILMILGITSIINPVYLEVVSLYDILITMAVTCIVLLFSATKNKISKSEGISLLCVFIVYNFYIFSR